MTPLDDVFPMAAAARLAAKNDGWRPHPGDRDLYVRGTHRIRLTQIDPRTWVWSEAT